MPAEASLRLQDGIYFRSGKKPGRAFRLVLLNARPEATTAEVRDGIATVWEMLARLRTENVDDLAPTPLAHPGDLTCLLGFGAALFERYPGLERPADIERLGPLPFNSLRWVPSDRRTGETHFAFQFIADTELAVDRALVELWLMTRSPAVPLEVVTVHDGFNREIDDGSWLGFHDGISNIEPSERRGAIEVSGGDTSWMEGGTYMAFLRVALDLEAWRRLARNHQEIIVGRDKLSGCPLTRVDPILSPVPVLGCPVGPSNPSSAGYKNPVLPGVDQPLLRQSHMHRANLNRQSPPADEQNNRLFRQGYDFVESPADGRLRIGLNFVSFQRSLGRLKRVLHLPGWMGDTNFGGVPDASPPTPDGLKPLPLISVIAGGYYAVPPDNGPPFPGAEIF